MHSIIDYSKSPAPQFDAVNDIKDWLGQHKYDEVAPQFAKITDPKQFMFMCMLGGISGFPVKAWYEHFHGQGSWVEPSGDD